jgi:hypothetical protein
MPGRESLVFRNARLQGIALSAQTCSKAGTLARSASESKGFGKTNEHWTSQSSARCLWSGIRKGTFLVRSRL